MILQNKETGLLIDPRTDEFALSPSDVLPGSENWDEALAQHSEIDIIEGYAVVRGLWIKDDGENNAEEFWGELSDAYPRIAKALRRDGRALVYASDWEQIQQLRGFSDGPSYAANALLVCEVVEHANQSDLGRQARINGLPCNSTDAAWIEGWCSVDGPPRIEAIDRTIQYGSCTLVGFFSDNAERALFSFYIDELSFADSELVGLTEDQAHQLRRDRDLAYLRS